MSKIKIGRNAAGNCIQFIGSSLPAYYNFQLRAQLNAQDTTKVDILNDSRTDSSGNTEFEFFALDFLDYAEDDGTAFTTAQEMVDYFNLKARAAGFTTNDGVDLGAYDLDFTIDATETTIMMNIGEYFPVNTLQAVEEDDDTISLYVLSDGTPLNGDENEDAQRYRNINWTTVTIEGGGTYGSLSAATNALNAYFTRSGLVSGVAPVLTSPTTVSLELGDVFSYELTATNLTEIEWTSLPSGVSVSSLNRRKLIGGANLTAGLYTLTGNLHNYYGSTAFSISVTVAATFVPDTRSVLFNNKDYARTVAGGASSIFSSSNWSVHFWVKKNSSNINNQTLFNYDGFLLSIDGGENRLNYKDKTGKHLRTANNAIANQTWTHILLVYVNNTITLYVDGVSEALTQISAGSGTPSVVLTDRFEVGRGDGHLRGVRVDQVALWPTDESANITTIYNSGATQDMSALSSAPTHWWRMGDGDTFPTLTDNIGTTDLTLINMNASDIRTDAP